MRISSSCSRCLRVSVTAILALLLTSTAAVAQGGTSTATLSGKVVDDTGGRLPRVTVTVTNAATNQSRTVFSNEEGLYRFAGLPPGAYSLRAEIQGFVPFTRSQLTLNVGAAVDPPALGLLGRQVGELALENAGLFAGFKIPNSCSAVGGSGGEVTIVEAEREAQNLVGVPLQRKSLLACCAIRCCIQLVLINQKGQFGKGIIDA